VIVSPTPLTLGFPLFCHPPNRSGGGSCYTRVLLVEIVFQLVIQKLGGLSLSLGHVYFIVRNYSYIQKFGFM
jgi:hypothetical protein